MFGSSCMYELLLISGVLALGLFERARIHLETMAS